MKPHGQFCLWDGLEIQWRQPCRDDFVLANTRHAVLKRNPINDYGRQPPTSKPQLPCTGLWESERECSGRVVGKPQLIRAPNWGALVLGGEISRYRSSTENFGPVVPGFFLCIDPQAKNAAGRDKSQKQRGRSPKEDIFTNPVAQERKVQ